MSVNTYWLLCVKEIFPDPIMQPSQKSDKLHIIDQFTLEQAKQNENKNLLEVARKIRNSKYKRHHNNSSVSFVLSALINAGRKKKLSKAHAHHRKGATVLTQPRLSVATKRGKIRANGLKKISKLKKLILKYRLQKSSIKYPNDDPHQIKEPDIQMDTELDGPSGSKTQKILNTAFIVPDIDEISTTSQLFQSKVATVTDKLDSLILQEASNNANQSNKTQFFHTNEFIETVKEVDDFISQQTSPPTNCIKSIHSRRFREYCDNCTTPELASLSTEILKKLDHFQRRAYAKNPIKANAHRRFVIGFRETQNHLRINKVKLVLIATDCEGCSLTGGIDETIKTIKMDCKTLEVPCAFALQRRSMAHALKKKGNISCVSILDNDGVREQFTQLLTALEIAKAKYLNTN